MKTRQLIICLLIFILGIIFTIIGALFKIQHWPYGSETLILGSILEVISLIVLIVILAKHFLSK